MVTSPVFKEKASNMALAQCVPADLSLGFTTEAAVTGGLLADLTPEALTTVSTMVGLHETQIDKKIGRNQHQH